MGETLKRFFNYHLLNDNRNEEMNKGLDNEWHTYKEWGYLKASNQGGHLLAFKGCLNLVKKHFLHKQGSDESKIQKDIANAKAEVEKIDIDIQRKESVIKSFETQMNDRKEKIGSLKKEIINIQENPSSISTDKISKVGFYIGLGILLFLTIYLFIFYSSASYSGFFKDFTDGLNSGVASAIFDPQAIIKAYNAGVTEVILILTIPFIFLGLGYLIHKFQEGKGFAKFIKIATMILVTFAFDGLLAYKIEKGLYEIERINDPTGMIPPHKLSMAFESENFWLVIFAGFIVYIIWGFIFDFVMESYDKLDVIKQAINSRKKEIRVNEDEITRTKEEINIAENNISDLKLEKAEQDKIIRGDTTLIDWSGFERELHNFTEGWTHWMTDNGLTQNFKDNVWKSLEYFTNEHQKGITARQKEHIENK